MPRHLIRRLMLMGENRLELLLVELQEGRDRCLQALFWTLAAAVLFLLGGIVLSAAVVVAFWNQGPLLTLAVLGISYIAIGALMWRRMSQSMKNWDSFSGTREQFRKDRQQMERFIQ